MIRKTTTVAALALLATAGTSFAVDYDPTGQAGQFDATRAADVVRGTGGSFAPSRVYVPVILDELDGLFNSPAVQNNPTNNTPFGAWTTFGAGSAQPPVRVVGAFGATDASNPAGGSNDVFLSEGPTGASNTIGALTADGTLVYRANFNSAVNQNNLEVRNLMWPMNTATPTTGSPNRVFGPFAGIDGTPGGSTLLGTPGAARFNNDLYSGVTIFDGFTGAALRGVNVYLNLGNDPLNPVDVWGEAGAPRPSLPGPTPVDGETRQTQPAIQVIDLPNGDQAVYSMFGVGFSPSSGSGTLYTGGSARPLYFIIDEVNGNNYADGFAFIDADGDNDLNLANPGVRFIDHQATGGGTNVFAGRMFDINSSGQVVALFEDRSVIPRVFEVQLFNPIFSAAGDAITGYEAPITIARSGQDGIPEDLQTIGGTPSGPIFLVPFSGVAIDDNGRVAFVAVTETFETPAGDGLIRLQNTTNDLFVWEPCTESLHSVLKGGQNGDVLATGAGVELSLGVFPVDQASDGFTGAGFSDNGGQLVVAFRNNADEGGVDRDMDGLIDQGGSLRPGAGNEASVRGIVALTLGEFVRDCPTDTNGDGVTNFADLNAILTNFGADGLAVQCIDTNGDGVVNFADLNAVLSSFGENCDVNVD